MKSASFVLKLLVFLTILTVLASPALAILTHQRLLQNSGIQIRDRRNEGEEERNCKLPDGKKVDAWGFLEGEVVQEHSYCGKMGYELKLQ